MDACGKRKVKNWWRGGEDVEERECQKDYFRGWYGNDSNMSKSGTEIYYKCQCPRIKC